MMRRYEYDPATKEGWKSYPIGLTTSKVSECHNQPQVLVQSMEGGYVTANCVACGEKDTLSLEQVAELGVYVACPDCRQTMKAGYVPDSSGGNRNYGFRCDACDVYIWLADLLPHWKDAP